jgi:hypothetical protein
MHLHKNGLMHDKKKLRANVRQDQSFSLKNVLIGDMNFRLVSQ